MLFRSDLDERLTRLESQGSTAATVETVAALQSDVTTLRAGLQDSQKKLGEMQQELAAAAGLKGHCYPDVPAAVRAAQEKSLPEDFIFVGGSSFIVADLLANRDALNLY